jgi:hypothetical protein
MSHWSICPRCNWKSYENMQTTSLCRACDFSYHFCEEENEDAYNMNWACLNPNQKQTPKTKRVLKLVGERI